MNDKLKELHALCKPAAEAMSDSERLTRLVQLYPEVINMAFKHERERIAKRVVMRGSFVGPFFNILETDLAEALGESSPAQMIDDLLADPV